jgi:hypothetical protein
VEPLFKKGQRVIHSNYGPATVTFVKESTEIGLSKIVAGGNDWTVPSYNVKPDSGPGVYAGEDVLVRSRTKPLERVT